MEAVAALSLGCNILQLVGTAVTTGRFIHEVYKTGKIDHKDRVSDRLTQLEELARASEKLAEQPSLESAQNEVGTNLSQIVQMCASDARTLRKELESLKIAGSGGRYQRFKFGVKAAVKNMPNKVKEAQRRLEENLGWINSGVMQVLASDVRQLIHEERIEFEKLDETSKAVLRKMDEGFVRLEAVQQKSEANIVAHIDNKLVPQTSEQEKLLHQAQSAQRLDQNRSQLLESLTYKDMDRRVNDIRHGSEDTFDWILDPQRDHLRHNFATWLTNDKPLYWIQGLAGSGKSTLMSRIWNDKRTQMLVARNSTDPPSPVLKHSFWLLSQDRLLKGYKGMLCNTIHGLLSSNLSAVDYLLNKDVSFRSLRVYDDWSERDLETTLYDLLADRELFNVTCIFLDGLDEIELPTDHHRLLRCIRTLSVFDKFRTKICMSSRPEMPWTREFPQEPQLRLQDLTKADIRSYAAEYLSSVLPPEEDGPSYHSHHKFLDEFVERSRGVFLWARLAVNILLGMPMHASWPDVNDRLKQMPPEMELLYEQILEKRSRDTDSEKVEAATYLSLCLEGSCGGLYADRQEGFFLHQVLPIRKRYFQKNSDWQRQCDRKTFTMDHQDLEERILSMCACLLTCHYGSSVQEYPVNDRWRGEPLCMNGIQWHATKPRPFEENPSVVWFTFAHRTAADFLTDTPGGRQIIRRCQLSPADIFMAYVDADMLRWRLWNEYALLYNRLGTEALLVLMRGIWKFATARSGAVSDLHICQAIQKVKEVFAGLFVPHVSSSGDRVSDAASAYTFNLVRNQCVTEFIESWIGFDVEGLLLELGIDVWYKSCHGDFTKPDASRCHSLTTTYRNYLLICATKGNLPDVAHHLIQNGADFYAEHYLPINNPGKRSAAGELLVISSHANLTPANVTAWADVLSCCSYKTQHLPFQPSWGCRAGVQDCFMMRFSYPGKKYTGYATTFVLDVGSHLNLWLQHAAKAQGKVPIVDPDHCVGYCVLIKPDPCETFDQPDPFEMSTHLLYARSWHGFVDKGRHGSDLGFPHALPFKCCQCLADEGDEFWQVLPAFKRLDIHHKGCHLDDQSPLQVLGGTIPRSAITTKLSELTDPSLLTQSNKEPSPQQSVLTQDDSWEDIHAGIYRHFLVEHDFLRDPSNPQVPQGPIRVFGCVDREPTNVVTPSP